MNVWQVMRQLKDTLSNATWPDGSAENVFGKVLVAAAVPEKGFGRLRFPLAQIIPDAAEADEEEPELLMQDFVLRIVQRVENDAFGESVVLGGPRSNGQGTSAGRGVLEIEEEALKSIGDQARLQGVQIREKWRTAIAVAEEQRLGNLAVREIGFRAWTTTLRGYPAPTRLAATAPGGGVASLTWSIPPARFDRNALVLRRASGSTAPASVTDGTGVTVGALVTSLSDSPGAGTFSYSLFMGYDEINEPPSSSDRYSSAASVTVVVT